MDGREPLNLNGLVLEPGEVNGTEQQRLMRLLSNRGATPRGARRRG